MGKDISGGIKKYGDEILEDVIRLVRIPSVRGPELPGKPFGEGPAQALAYCLHLGESFGLSVKNCGNYAGHVEYGKGEGLFGILTHVDVVPPGEGWTMQPFGGEMKDGRVYGRGTMDDKSQAVAAIYCLKALKDMGIQPKMRIRVILGAGEETGMSDMEEYFKAEEMPDFAFTPDGEYPVCNREKGILQVRLTGPGGPICFESGTAPNMVPGYARAELSSGEEAGALAAAAGSDSGARFVTGPQGNGFLVECYGSAAHASKPENGENAAAHLLHLLEKTGFLREKTGFFAFLRDCACDGFSGQNMGIACSDAESGALTMNLGVVQARENAAAVLDIRYPVTLSSRPLIDTIRRKAAQYGLDAEVLSDVPPLFLPENGPLVSRLQKAYTLVTHRPAATYSTGGGSYARALNGRGVAFGSGFQDLSFYHIHSADEFLVVEELMEHCRVCLQAIYEAACAPGGSR